jgi:hypothetical protein
MAEYASAATMLQLVSTTCASIEWLWQTVEALRLAHKHVQTLEGELRWMRFLLKSMASVLGRLLHSVHDNAKGYRLLTYLPGVLRRLCNTVEEVKDGDDMSTRRWLLNSRKCGRLTAEIKNSRERMLYFLLLSQRQVHPKSYLTALTAPSFMRSPEDAYFRSFMRMAERDEEMIAVEPTLINTTQATPSSPTPQTDATTIPRHSASPLSVQSEALNNQTIRSQRLTDSESCPSGCRCTCHAAQVRRYSTQSIRVAIAPVAICIGKVNFTRKCSIPGCNAKNNRRDQRTISFSSRFLDKVFTASILYEGLKFRSYLNMPGYVPEYADVIRAAVSGDLETLQRLFTAGMADPNDTGLDGWSVLQVS